MRRMGPSVEAEVLHRPRSVGSSTRPWPGLLLDGCIGEPLDHIVLLRPYRSLVCSKLDYGCLVYGPAGQRVKLRGYDPPSRFAAAFHAISDQSLHVKAMGLIQHS